MARTAPARSPAALTGALARVFAAETAWSTAATLTGALLVTAFILWTTGQPVLSTFVLILRTGLGSVPGLADTLLQATPLIFTGLATALSFRAGVFNVGVEGALYLGAFAAAWVGFSFPGLPGPVLILAAFAAAVLVGGLWLAVPAALKVYLRVDEVVSTLMLNYVAINLTSYLVNYPFRAPGLANSMSPPVAEQGHLARLLPPSQLNISLVIAVLLTIAVAGVLDRTRLGFEIRTVGHNPEFARIMGISVARVTLTVMVLSGAIGGLAGGAHVLGVNYRFIDGFSPGWGYEGITIALLARHNPWGILVAGLLFGVLRNGGGMIQIFSHVPISIIDILQATIVLLVTAQVVLPRPGRRNACTISAT